MNFILIGLGAAAIVFGLAQAVHILGGFIRGGPVTVGAAIMKPIYAGIGIGLGLWLLSLGGIL